MTTHATVTVTGQGGRSVSAARPLPERVATVNTLLNAVPPALREALLTEFLSLSQRPTHG